MSVQNSGSLPVTIAVFDVRPLGCRWDNVGMRFHIFVLFLEDVKEPICQETLGYNENGFTLRTSNSVSASVPRNRMWYVDSCLPGFDCDGVGCYDLLVRPVIGDEKCSERMFNCSL